MNPATATTHPSDLFCEAVESISVPVMASILKCGKTHIYKQAARPDEKGEARTSFIEKIERMLEALMEKNPILAQTIADRICRVCGGRFVTKSQAKADKATLLEELTDNIIALAKYTEIASNPKSTYEERTAAKLALFAEIEQDFDESLN
nr:hypothetical protein [uncultured Desulfobacter sp.]